MKKFFLLAVISILILPSCRSSKGGPDNSGAGDPTALSEEQSKVLITPTIYDIAIHDGKNLECAAADLRDMKTNSGDFLASVCGSFFAKCLLQGSCKVLVGGSFQLLHYTPLKSGEARFTRVDEDICRFSYGTNQVCVDPFHSVAAELSKYKAGTVIYIPAIIGTILPDGTTHNGYFIVRDSGSKIKGYGRFDFFTGYYQLDKTSNPFVQLGLAWKGTHFAYTIIGGDEADKILIQRNYPQIPDQK
jgi:3D (Asp-Asp-Asp) domain-containing protein